MYSHLRISAIAAAGLAAALTLTACGSDSSPEADKKPATSAPAPAATPAAGAAADGLDGGWISMQPGKGVVLTVKGKNAIVIETATGLTCDGTTDGKSFDLKCPTGATRSKGKVDSVDATSLKVTWEGAGTDTYQKSEPGKLPALPTKK
ncbi:hypothetical protein [Streptomyces sp. NPDC059874]|uniref:hypothetical protein n=1 Tax=Streptomyces sp. NPDC059874 TaxID=3346983 RepID=UPI00365B6F24